MKQRRPIVPRRPAVRQHQLNKPSSPVTPSVRRKCIESSRKSEKGVALGPPHGENGVAIPDTLDAGTPPRQATQDARPEDGRTGFPQPTQPRSAIMANKRDDYLPEPFEYR